MYPPDWTADHFPFCLSVLFGGLFGLFAALTDCRWWFESLLVHSGVSSATRRKATGADHTKKRGCLGCLGFGFVFVVLGVVVFFAFFLNGL